MSNYAIRLRATVDEQGALIKALLTHPMENGFRRNAAGEIAAAHYITEITLRINDEPVTTLLTGSGIAANPLFGWRTVSYTHLDVYKRQVHVAGHGLAGAGVSFFQG